ncbi:hypothetical protein M514_06150 [Trichuris suis]|uniref:Uncharacterized protein n=1 Tax=Trichuris suis TaxID=68888 RepID=A0A085M738_9BILA|nr:hypothetical protein M513_06150 [Trichuris suis]KFD69825.1 hypothetical protein M514_06150 [Trichuris suis]
MGSYSWLHATVLITVEVKEPSCLSFAAYCCIVNIVENLNASHILVEAIDVTTAGKKQLHYLCRANGDNDIIITFVQQFIMKEV